MQIFCTTESVPLGSERGERFTALAEDARAGLPAKGWRTWQVGAHSRFRRRLASREGRAIPCGESPRSIVRGRGEFRGWTFGRASIRDSAGCGENVSTECGRSSGAEAPVHSEGTYAALKRRSSTRPLFHGEGRVRDIFPQSLKCALPQQSRVFRTVETSHAFAKRRERIGHAASGAEAPFIPRGLTRR